MARQFVRLRAHMDTRTVVLGPEWDQQLATRLRVVLRQLGAIEAGGEWGVAGSQELLQSDWLIDSQRVRIEAETYIGLSISGPSAVLDRIVTALQHAAPPV